LLALLLSLEAYKVYGSRIEGEDQSKSLEAKIEFGATMALLRGIKDVADNTMAIAPEKVAAAIARAQARQMIDFSNIDTGFNPGFTMLLVSDISKVENNNDLPPAEMLVGAGEMLQVLGYVDVAYTAFMLAGIPQEVLDRAFDRAILNQRLTTAIKVYGIWATEETAIS